MALTFVRTDDGRISATTSKTAYMIPADHPAYAKLHAACKAGEAARKAKDAAAMAAAEALVDELAPVPTALAAVTGGRLTYEKGVVYYAGQPCQHEVSKLIVDKLNGGYPAAPLMRFLERLMNNPSKRVVDNLHTFCEKFGLTIDAEGYILAFKRVTQDWKDCHTESVDNRVGAAPELPRNAVSDDPNVACSEGFHFGSAGYVNDFNRDGRVVVVRVDPTDVVLVPYDLSQQKARCCKYTVLREHTGGLAPGALGTGFKHAAYGAGLDEPYDAANDHY